MQYTDEQYAMLARFENGLNINDLTPDEMQLYYFLIDQKLLQPRYDIEEGLHFLTELGKVALHQHRSAVLAAQQQAEQAAKKDAEAQKQRRFDNKIKITNLAISLTSFLIGLGVEFYVGVYARAVEWYEGFQAWFASLFH